MTIKFKPNLGQPGEVDERLTHHLNELAKGRDSMAFKQVEVTTKENKKRVDKLIFFGTSTMDEAIVKWGFWKQAQIVK